MRSLHPYAMRGSYLRSCVLVTAIALLAVAGCGPGEREKPATLPPVTPGDSSSGETSIQSPSPSATTTHGLSDEEQVRAIYVAFLARYREGQDMQKVERKRHLSQWMTDPALSSTVEGIEEQRKAHKRSYGEFTPHIMSTKLSGDTATVNDCVDQSDFVLKNTRTGKIEGGESPDRFWSVATLEKTPSGWRVSFTKVKDESCKDR